MSLYLCSGSLGEPAMMDAFQEVADRFDPRVMAVDVDFDRRPFRLDASEVAAANAAALDRGPR